MTDKNVIVPTRSGLDSTEKNAVEINGELHAWFFQAVPYDQSEVLEPGMSTTCPPEQAGIPVCPDSVFEVPCEVLSFCVPPEGTC